MKELKELKGAKVLSKNEQKAIKGGVFACGFGHKCPPGWTCPKDYNYPSNMACTRYMEL